MELNKFVDEIKNRDPRTELTKIKAAIEFFKTLSDDEIEEYNQVFYEKLEEAYEVAEQEFSFDGDTMAKFYKLLLWTEFGESL